MRRMNSMLLGHQGASARTDCMYFSIASRVAASSQDSGSHTVRLGTSMSAVAGTPSCASSSASIRVASAMRDGS